jgi:regulatory protein
VPGAEDVLPTHQPPAESPGRTRWSGAATAAASGEHDGTDDPDDPDADAENVARTIALRKLTAQARTRHELDQALQKKNVPDEVAASVLDRLEEVGLVDDQIFAQDWVASRQRRRHLSRSALRRELRGKGVDREHVDAALATVDIDDELAAARALVAKKAAASRGLTAVVRHRRLAGALARRGFSSGIIATVLGELDDEPADEPAGDGDA